MAEYRIPAANWPAALAEALREAVPGDTVIVRTEPMRLLAESAAERMRKAGVVITVADKLDDLARVTTPHPGLPACLRMLARAWYACSCRYT